MLQNGQNEVAVAGDTRHGPDSPFQQLIPSAKMMLVPRIPLGKPFKTELTDDNDNEQLKWKTDV